MPFDQVHHFGTTSAFLDKGVGLADPVGVDVLLGIAAQDHDRGFPQVFVAAHEQADLGGGPGAVQVIIQKEAIRFILVRQFYRFRAGRGWVNGKAEGPEIPGQHFEDPLVIFGDQDRVAHIQPGNILQNLCGRVATYAAKAIVGAENELYLV